VVEWRHEREMNAAAEVAPERPTAAVPHLKEAL